MRNKVLVTGATGQDGGWLIKQLADQNKYEIYAMVRRTTPTSSAYIIRDLRKIGCHIVMGDLSDATSINKIVKKIQPDFLYNLAAQSFVGYSWDAPLATNDINAGGVLRFLEAIKEFSPHTRFYQAATSEMFGKVHSMPQNECTPFYPRSPYGISKVAAYWFVKHYREAYNLHACNGILFNHESETRGPEFVTRKITKAAARIRLGKQSVLELGNLEARRDWGYAPDFTQAMQLILEADKPDDYVVGTGEARSVREFCEAAFSYLSLDYRDYIKISEEFFRPAEVDILLADPSKIKRELGWTPTTPFGNWVAKMVEADLKREGNNE